MDINELNNKLKELKAEEIVWIIYIGIIILSFYSNELERKYFINNDLESKKKYTDLMIIIFTILLIIYMYFAKFSLDDVRNLKENDSTDKKRLTYLSFCRFIFNFNKWYYIFIYSIPKRKFRCGTCV